MSIVHKIVITDSGEELNPALVDSFSFQVDIQSLNSKAIVKIKDITHTLYNQIKTGLSVNIVFYDTADTQVTYTNYMKVLSFNKKPSNVENLADYIDVTLVSAWYFDSNVIISSSYNGTYYDIVNSVLVGKKGKYFNLDLLATDDNSRWRYRISETEQQFLSRMMKYGRRSNLPVYLYSDAKGNLRLRGVDDFVKGTCKYYTTPDTAMQLETVPSNASDLKYLRMTAYKVNADTANSNSRTSTLFTTANFKLNKTVESGVSINNSEVMNSQSLNYTPPTVDFINWNLTPDDALSVATKNDFEKNMFTYSVTCIIPDLLVNLDLGEKLKVYLPFKPVQGRKTGTITNLGEGEYFIKHMDFIYKNNQYRTRLVMIQAAY